MPQLSYGQFMLKDRILPRSIGLEGPDFVNKTRFSLILIEMLRRYGQKAIYVPLPFLKSTITGKIFPHTREIAKQAVPMLFSTNRLEILPVLTEWIGASEKNWVVHDRTKMVGPVYAWATIGWELNYFLDVESQYPDTQIGVMLRKPLSESMQIMKKRAQSNDFFKSQFDKDVALQKKIRKGFQQMIKDRQNWFNFDVSGFANTREEFRSWEIEKALRLWCQISRRVGHAEWSFNAKDAIVAVRDQLPEDVEPKRKIEMLPVRKELFRNLYGHRGGREKVLSQLYAQ